MKSVLPPALQPIKEELLGWCKTIFDQIFVMPKEMRMIISKNLSSTNGEVEKAEFTFTLPENLAERVSLFQEHFTRTGIWPSADLEQGISSITSIVRYSIRNRSS